MTTIENQQIKGVTFNTVKTIVLSTVVTCSFIFGMYYGLVGKIEKIGQTTEANNRLIDLRLSYLEQKISALELQINKIKTP
jgi:hypothetical protein